MAYEKIDWTASTFLSAKNLNHMETMAVEVKPPIDAHIHSTIHYSKAQSDALCFPEAAGLDADLIDGISFDDLIGAQIPPGGVMLYYGSDADFENGGYLKASNKWHISDGGTYGGTPTIDMRGYFPRCPNTISGTGTGGRSTITPTGTAVLGDHTLIIDEIPSHAHYLADYRTDQISPNIYEGTGTRAGSCTATARSTSFNHEAEADPHGHAGASVSFYSITKAQAYRALYFLARVAA